MSIENSELTVAVDHFDNGPFEAYTNRIYPPVEIGTKLYTHPAPSVLKDDQIAALVNKVRDIARMFHDHQSLRERIAIELVPALKAEAKTGVPGDVVRYSERELELIDGMIAVQLDHAQRCDAISNRVMGEKQKGWDMERVELLRRIRYFGITAHAQKGTNGEIS